MQKPLHHHVPREDYASTPTNILYFVAILLLVALATLVLYTVPIEVLIIGMGIGFVPMALYFILHH